jgi:hypothetical protein
MAARNSSIPPAPVGKAGPGGSTLARTQDRADLAWPVHVEENSPRRCRGRTITSGGRRGRVPTRHGQGHGDDRRDREHGPDPKPPPDARRAPATQRLIAFDVCGICVRRPHGLRPHPPVDLLSAGLHRGAAGGGPPDGEVEVVGPALRRTHGGAQVARHLFPTVQRRRRLWHGFVFTHCTCPARRLMEAASGLASHVTMRQPAWAA